MRAMRASWLLALLVFRFSESKDFQPFEEDVFPVSPKCNTSTEFTCGSGRIDCIPIAWQCDNIRDCSNGTDEIDCEPGYCKEGELLCDDGSCVPGAYKCDGHQDCPSDEKYCVGYTHILSVPPPFNFGDPKLYNNDTGLNKYGCLPGFGFCATQKLCIPNLSFCNGLVDCLLGSEDELRCAHEKSVSWQSSPCEDKFVCKKNETWGDQVCIQMGELCNGKKECPLGDDESEKCSECSTKKCDHHCTNTPTGAECSCNKGYQLDSDGVSCVDFDECTLPKRVCHHFCENRIGSFVCSCAKGYYLEENGISCRSTNTSEGFLLSSFSLGIEKRPLEDFSETNSAIAHPSLGLLMDFDYSRRDDKMFMVVNVGHDMSKIVLMEENGIHKILQENVSQMTKLAVDWIGGNLFLWEMLVERSSDSLSNIDIRISVCTMNGKFCRGIIEKIGHEYQMFHGLVIHPMRGLVFYLDHQNGTHRIMMANMDGSQIQALTETNHLMIAALAIDYVNNDLYFIEMPQHNIQRINIDTKKIEVIASSQFLMYGTDSMVYHNGFLYWTEGYGHLRVLEVTRDNARIHSLTRQNMFMSTGPQRLAINDSLHQIEPSSNPCKKIDCPWICVIVPDFTAKCLCPDGYNSSLLGTTCLPPAKDSVKQDNLTHIGFELMSDYCKSGVGCLNGGVCREVFNNTRIVCDCVGTYDGLYCERRKPILSDEAILIIIPAILLLLFIAIGCGVYWFFFHRRNKKDGVTDTTSIVSKSTVSGTARYENDAVLLE